MAALIIIVIILAISISIRRHGSDVYVGMVVVVVYRYTTDK